MWHWRPSPDLAEVLYLRGRVLLSPDEDARYQRYLVPGAAQTFLAARLLVRFLLSAYAPLSTQAWRFETNPWGRPYIANTDAPPGLVFNLSHKPGFITCLIGNGRELGVDVEDSAARRTYLLEIASRFFSASEFAALEQLPEAARPQRFYELWTLKEAYIKARGRGLSLGLSRFSFAPSGDTASVRFDPGFDDDSDTWDFRLFRANPNHLIATAVRRTPQPLRIEVTDAAELMAGALQ